MCICCTMCVLLFFTLDAGLLARSQYPEGPATGHLDTGFSCFPCVYKQMLRWFARFQVAATCFSCSPPDLVTNFIFCMHVKQPLPPGDNPIAVNKYYYYFYYYLSPKLYQFNNWEILELTFIKVLCAAVFKNFHSYTSTTSVAFMTCF